MTTVTLPRLSLAHVLNAYSKDPSHTFKNYAWIADLGKDGICLVATDGHRAHAARVAKGSSDDTNVDTDPVPLGACIEIAVAKLRLQAAKKSQFVTLEIAIPSSPIAFPDVPQIFAEFPPATHKICSATLNALGQCQADKNAFALVYEVAGVQHLGLWLRNLDGPAYRLLQGPPPLIGQTKDRDGKPIEEICAVNPEYLAQATEHLDNRSVQTHPSKDLGLILKTSDGGPGLLAIVMCLRLPS